MRKFRLLFLALPLVVAGCILTTGQFKVPFDLGDIVVNSPTSVQAVDVDLNTIDTYAKHKDQLQGLADLALLGRVVNTGAADLGVEAWITPGYTSYTTDTQVKANAIRAWGPFKVAAGETVQVDWNRSAKLFSAAGKAALLHEVKGDGQFTVYVIGASGTYSFRVDKGVLVVVIEAES